MFIRHKVEENSVIFYDKEKKELTMKSGFELKQYRSPREQKGFTFGSLKEANGSQVHNPCIIKFK